jgi:hypothetical protein
MNIETRDKLDNDLKALLLALESRKKQCPAKLAIASRLADSVTAPEVGFNPSVHVLRHGWRDYWHSTKPDLLYGLFALDFPISTGLVEFRSKPKKPLDEGSEEAKVWDEGVKALLQEEEKARECEAENRTAMRALELVFLTMVRFVLDSDTPAEQATNMNALHRAIRTYLKCRGIAVLGVGRVRPSSRGKTKGKGKHVEERMVAVTVKNPESRDWTAEQFASHLKCSISTVCGTDCWKALRSFREQQRLDALD